jgi:hypothetical protein
MEAARDSTNLFSLFLPTDSNKMHVVARNTSDTGEVVQSRQTRRGPALCGGVRSSGATLTGSLPSGGPKRNFPRRPKFIGLEE